MDNGISRHEVLFKDPSDIENMDKGWDWDMRSNEQKKRDLESSLRKADLFEHEIKLLSMRFVGSMTFEDISHVMGIEDPRLTHRYYKRALKRYEQYLKGKKNGK